MKAIMISIQPKWVERIANGEKTIEVRKNRPKLETPFKCYIYCTNGKPYLYREANGKKELFLDSDLYCGGTYEDRFLSGKVIGEFVCDWIDEFDVPYPAWSKECLKDIIKNSCLTYNDLHSYIGSGKSGYGWHISDLKIYDEPKELSDFGQKCRYAYFEEDERVFAWVCDVDYCEYECSGYCLRDGLIPLERPFPGWGYVEEVEE